jgi:hypothetical protein
MWFPVWTSWSLLGSGCGPFSIAWQDSIAMWMVGDKSLIDYPIDYSKFAKRSNRFDVRRFELNLC